MAFDGLTMEFLEVAAASGEPIRVERGVYMIEVFVRRMESWEIGPEPEPDHRFHPLTSTDRPRTRARSVGR